MSRVVNKLNEIFPKGTKVDVKLWKLTELEEFIKKHPVQCRNIYCCVKLNDDCTFMLPSIEWWKEELLRYSAGGGMQREAPTEIIKKIISELKPDNSKDPKKCKGLIPLNMKKIPAVCKTFKQYNSELRKVYESSVMKDPFQSCTLIDRKFYKSDASYYRLDVDDKGGFRVVPQKQMQNFIDKLKEKYNSAHDYNPGDWVICSYNNDWKEIELPFNIKMETLKYKDLDKYYPLPKK